MTSSKVLTPIQAAVKYPIEDSFTGERFPVELTISKRPEGKIRFYAPIYQLAKHGKNWQRPRCPVTGRFLLVDGDVAVLKGQILLLWGKVWHGIPSTDCLMEWTMDSVCPTPDGDEVEPDAPDSWLSLLGLV